MPLKMDSCPFSLDRLEEFKLGKTLQEGEPIPGRARLHPYFSTAILLWLPTYLFPSLMWCFPFLFFPSPKRTPKEVFCTAALIWLETKVPWPHLTSICSEWEQNAEPEKASISVGQCWAAPMPLLLFSQVFISEQQTPSPFTSSGK